MRLLQSKLLAALFVSACVVGTSTAVVQQTPARARVELVSSVKSIAPGEPFVVALSFDVDPDWHLYWKDPGDSGMPPSVKWTLPEGFTASELQFPKPKTIQIPAGVNYIHEGRFALLVTITPPATLKEGESVELAGNVKWLECDAEICLPAKQSVAVSVQSDKQSVLQHEKEFEAWRSAVKAGEGFSPQK